MGESKKTILRLLSLTIIGLIFLFRLSGLFNSISLKNLVIIVVIGIAGLALLIWTTKNDFKDYKKTKRILCFIPSIVGLTMILIAFGLNLHQNLKYKVPTIIRIYSNGILARYSVDLKNNNEYIVTNADIDKMTHLFGRYSIKDSIITLDKPNLDNVLKTKTLVISSMIGMIDGKKDTIKYIRLIDDNGNEIKSDIFLEVDDTRKNN
jgi:hypothetical protein